MDIDQFHDTLQAQERPVFDQSAGGFIIADHRDLGAFPRSYEDAVQALASKVRIASENRRSQIGDHPESPAGPALLVR